MKLTKVVVVLVALGACVQCSAQDRVSGIAGRLMAKERSSWTLAIKKDAAAYTALHARNYLTVSDGGVLGKAQSEASALDVLSGHPGIEVRRLSAAGC